MEVSLGIITCRDRENVSELLKSIFSQKLMKVKITEIIIVAPDEDETYIKQAVEASGKWKRKILFVNEGTRKGKSTAVNLFLKLAKSNLLVLCSGDVTLEENALERLCAPLAGPEIGIVASRPVPVGESRNRWLDQTVKLLWELRDAISLPTPKFGEFLAFRNLNLQIPKTAVDEEMLAALITSKGYRGAYARDAVVYNKGPKTVADYLKQRRRIYCGHLTLKKEQGYTVPSVSNIRALRCFLSDKSLRKRQLPGLAYGTLLEGISRFLGTVDFMRGVDHSRWKIIHKN